MTTAQVVKEVERSRPFAWKEASWSSFGYLLFRSMCKGGELVKIPVTMEAFPFAYRTSVKIIEVIAIRFIPLSLHLRYIIRLLLLRAE